jgi:hypothetical protein
LLLARNEEQVGSCGREDEMTEVFSRGEVEPVKPPLGSMLSRAASQKIQSFSLSI